MTELNIHPSKAQRQTMNISPMIIEDDDFPSKKIDTVLLSRSDSKCDIDFDRKVHAFDRQKKQVPTVKKISTKFTKKMALNSLSLLRLRKLDLARETSMQLPDTRDALLRANDMQYETQDENFGFPMPRRTRRAFRRNSFVIHRSRGQSHCISDTSPSARPKLNDLTSSFDRTTQQVQFSLNALQEIMARGTTGHESERDEERGSLGDRMRRLRLDS